MEPRSPALQADSLRAEPQGKRKNTGVGSLSLLQRIFPTQGSNLGLQHCRQILYELSHKGSPRILEWVAYPFSRGSSQPRDQTGVSCIAGQFFTNWAMREAQSSPKSTDIWWISKICCPSKIKNHNLRPWWPSVEEFSSHCRRHSLSLIWEYPTCGRAAKSVCHNYGTCVLEPWKLKLLSPRATTTEVCTP